MHRIIWMKEKNGIIATSSLEFSERVFPEIQKALEVQEGLSLKAELAKSRILRDQVKRNIDAERIWEKRQVKTSGIVDNGDYAQKKEQQLDPLKVSVGGITEKEIRFELKYA